MQVKLNQIFKAVSMFQFLAATTQYIIFISIDLYSIIAIQHYCQSAMAQMVTIYSKITSLKVTSLAMLSLVFMALAVLINNSWRSIGLVVLQQGQIGLKKRVAQGTVIYVVGESGIGVPRRVKAWEKKFNNEQLVNNLVRIERPVFPASPDSLNQLLETIAMIKIIMYYRLN